MITELLTIISAALLEYNQKNNKRRQKQDILEALGLKNAPEDALFGDEIVYALRSNGYTWDEIIKIFPFHISLYDLSKMARKHAEQSHSPWPPTESDMNDRPSYRGSAEYKLRENGSSWEDIANHMGKDGRFEANRVLGYSRAKQYAIMFGLPWPVPGHPPAGPKKGSVKHRGIPAIGQTAYHLRYTHGMEWNKIFDTMAWMLPHNYTENRLRAVARIYAKSHGLLWEY